jgi:hypothetical protein
MRKAGILALLCFVPRLALSDTSFTVLGARASGMGGAFTAVADDTTAFYWNPAAVARGPFVRLGFYGGGGFQDRGEMVNRLRSERPGDGSELGGDRVHGFATAFTVLGLAVSRFTHTRSILETDAVYSHGLQTWDIAASFVQSLPPDDLIIGGNVRYIRGTVTSDVTPVSEIPLDARNAADLIDRAVRGEGVTEGEPGFDLGVVYQPRDWIRLGLSARNLNRPTFHADNGDSVVLERHARTGVAFFLPRQLIVALDADISRHDTPVVDGGWREVAAGVEKSWSEGRFALRAGIRTEISREGTNRPGFSGGVGIRLAGFQLELTAVAASEKRLGSVWLGAAYVW